MAVDDASSRTGGGSHPDLPTHVGHPMSAPERPSSARVVCTLDAPYVTCLQDAVVPFPLLVGVARCYFECERARRVAVHYAWQKDPCGAILSRRPYAQTLVRTLAKRIG